MAATRINAKGLEKSGVKGVMFVKRLFDLVLAVLAALCLLLPIAVVAVCVRLTSKGPALYWSDRVGQHNRIFKMPKFRSMRTDTPAVATHLLTNPASFLTPIGSFLRKAALMSFRNCGASW